MFNVCFITGSVWLGFGQSGSLHSHARRRFSTNSHFWWDVGQIWAAVQQCTSQPDPSDPTFWPNREDTKSTKHQLFSTKQVVYVEGHCLVYQINGALYVNKHLFLSLRVSETSTQRWNNSLDIVNGFTKVWCSWWGIKWPIILIHCNTFS